MPQIRRIRIVNISYNNGKRLIPDELFDLTDEEGSAGLNTLISLINGGGKSVLVQLMMQPVLPRAHASSRRIEEFFTRSGDHGFILLEWQLENSGYRLLTGIAIAAAETNDESRGRNIKYYTFCSTYTQDSSKYGIVNLELARREGKKYLPADFDFIRKLAARSSGEMQYYSDRDNTQWKEKLEEYGILQEQWRTLTEKLNSSENGMTGYFEKFKTSDQLIDGLLIPAIEAHLAQDTAEENALSAMMLGVLEQYRKNEKRVEERENCRKFTAAMTERQKAVRVLWNTADYYGHAVADLFGFQAALGSALTALSAQYDELTAQQAEAEAALRRIGWEEASERYWKAKAAAEQAEEACRQAQEFLSQCKNSIELQKQTQRRMQAAKYAARIALAENDTAAISTQIQEKEQNSDAKQLTVLGASVRRILDSELPLMRDNVTKLQAEADAANIALQQGQKQQESAERAAKEARTASDMAEGALRQYQLDTDAQVQRLALDLQRTFTGCYSADELQKIADAKNAEQHTLKDTKAKVASRLQDITERIAQIPQKIADLQMQQNDCDNQLATLKKERENYLAAEETLRQIFALHSLDFAQRFTAAAIDYITGKLREAESELRQADRLLDQKTEELAAANAGTLHIPQTVLNWLDQTGIQYQTCESYLLKCELTAEQIEAVLQDCPAAAYGILVTKVEKQRLYAADRPDWLPAALPVFTYEDMTAIMQHIYAEGSLLGYYAQDCFADRNRFIEILQTEKDEISQTTDHITERMQRLKGELQTVSDFQYDEHWLPRNERAISEQNEIIAAITQQLAALKQEKSELMKQQDTLREQISVADSDINALTHILEKLQSLQVRLVEEEKLYKHSEIALDAAVQAEKAYQESCMDTRHAEALLADTQFALGIHRTLLDRAELAYIDTQNYTSETFAEGGWQSLYQQFQTLCKTQDDSIQVLRAELNAAQEKLHDAREELRKTGCQPAEYADTVYSEQEDAAILDELMRLETSQSELHQTVTACAQTNGEAQAAFKHTEQNLAEYGEPLSPSQITGDYQRRRSALKTKMRELKQTISEIGKLQSAYEKMFDRTKDALRSLPKSETVSPCALETDIVQQWEQLCETEHRLKKQLETQHNALLNDLKDLLSEFEFTSEAKAIGVMADLMQRDEAHGDRYYTLDELITESVKSTMLRVGQIDAELNDFDNTKQDLVRQCVLQGQQIYQGLQAIMKNSRIQAYEDTRKEMLKMDLPKEIDEKLAADEIAAEIERKAQEIIEKLSRGELTEAELKQKATDAVSSRHLLRLYIRKESIEIWGYKVDTNSSHAEYRRWKDIPRTNSGAEKFLVYFAVIVLLMDYSGSEAGIRSSEHTNVLILDNPFAVITSAHVLGPMFRMAKQFKIQLICLSDITKCDITNCFDLHIKAAVRQNTLSDIGILSHEGNEQIEHGFYRAAQYTLI